MCRSQREEGGGPTLGGVIGASLRMNTREQRGQHFRWRNEVSGESITTSITSLKELFENVQMFSEKRK